MESRFSVSVKFRIIIADGCLPSSVCCNSISSQSRCDVMMRAMVLEAAKHPLRCVAIDVPAPGPGQVLIRVHACAVCRTDLHVVDGELTEPKLPLIPGHEIVGTVAALGAGRGPFHHRRPRRRALARLHLRRLRVLPRRPGEPVRPGALHRLPDRRRLCRVHRRRPALLLRHPGQLHRRTRPRRCCAPG